MYQVNDTGMIREHHRGAAGGGRGSAPHPAAQRGSSEEGGILLGQYEAKGGPSALHGEGPWWSCSPAPPTRWTSSVRPPSGVLCARH